MANIMQHKLLAYSQITELGAISDGILKKQFLYCQIKWLARKETHNIIEIVMLRCHQLYTIKDAILCCDNSFNMLLRITKLDVMGHLLRIKVLLNLDEVFALDTNVAIYVYDLDGQRWLQCSCLSSEQIRCYIK